MVDHICVHASYVSLGPSLEYTHVCNVLVDSSLTFTVQNLARLQDLFKQSCLFESLVDANSAVRQEDDQTVYPHTE